MGTRADFYLGRGPKAVWLGSTAWDGHPENHMWLLKAKTADDFQKVVAEHIRGRDDGTRPSAGWPWPWTDSHLTDHAYAFDDGAVYVTMYALGEDGKYAGEAAPTCAVCNHSIDQWCKLDDVRKANMRRSRASTKHRKHVAAYEAAKDRFDVGLRKTEPKPPPDFDDEDPRFTAPRLGPTVFPDMSKRQNVTLGARSGVMILGVLK